MITTYEVQSSELLNCLLRANQLAIHAIHAIIKNLVACYMVLLVSYETFLCLV